MNDHTLRAQAYIRAEANLRAVEAYAKNLPSDDRTPLGLKVEWAFGAACDGYDAVRLSVQAQMAEILPAAIRGVRKDAEEARAIAFQQLRADLTHGA